MNLKRSSSALAAVAVIAGALVVGQASAASAATCEVHNGSTVKSGNNIRGNGSIDSSCGSSTRATITIQRWSTWRWVDMKSETVNGPGYDHFIYFDCRGWGTQTWRTFITGKNPATGKYSSKATNELRVAC